MFQHHLQKDFLSPLELLNTTACAELTKAWSLPSRALVCRITVVQELIADFPPKISPLNPTAVIHGKHYPFRRGIRQSSSGPQ